jgi:hypothetical protein
MPRLSGPVQAQGALVEVRVGWSALRPAGLRTFGKIFSLVPGHTVSGSAKR